MSKCNRCGIELGENDVVCLNCGALVSATTGIDKDKNEEKDQNSDSFDNSDIVNSANVDDNLFNNSNNSSTTNDGFDINFDAFDDVNSTFDTSGVDFDKFEAISSLEEDEEKVNLVDFKDEEYDSSNVVDSSGDIDKLAVADNDDQSGAADSDNKTQKSKINSEIILKYVFFVVLIVFIVLLIAVAYKYFSSKNYGKIPGEVDQKELNVESKYSLTENPNYITDKSWICGSSKNDDLSNDSSTYFQYDFYSDGRYVTQHHKQRETYEDGKYALSLDDISNDKYTYKITIIANLSSGYKKKYEFTLVTNKDGTKATYIGDNGTYACQEMDYYNNR